MRMQSYSCTRSSYSIYVYAVVHAYIIKHALTAILRMRTVETMAFEINCVICSKSQDEPLTEWKTFEFSTIFRTFREYFNSPQLAEMFGDEIEFKKLQLKEARIGMSKVDCDPADLELDMYHTMKVFGHYVKFIVDDCVTQ